MSAATATSAGSTPASRQLLSVIDTQLNELERALAQADALSATTWGSSFDAFEELDSNQRSNLLWILSDKIGEAAQHNHKAREAYTSLRSSLVD